MSSNAHRRDQALRAAHARRSIRAGGAVLAGLLSACSGSSSPRGDSAAVMPGAGASGSSAGTAARESTAPSAGNTQMPASGSAASGSTADSGRPPPPASGNGDAGSGSATPDAGVMTATDAGPAPDASSAPSTGKLVPARGALLGIFYGADSVAETEAKLGRKVPVHLTYYAWEDDWTGRITQQDLAAGRIPLVNWEPHTPKLTDIASGVYDEMVHVRARGAEALGEPFFLDFGAEMNGDWSPWSGAQNGMGPEQYLAAYRHLHDLFVADGATNVVWLWCPNVTDEPRSSWNATLGYYPGDAYVDWACVDGYNWGSTNGGGWQSFAQVFEDVYPKLASTGKPIFIGEMASTESGGDKAAWIDAMIPTLRDDFPLIKGLVWFDIDKETDWRISSSPEAEQAFKRMADDPYFNP